MTATANEQGVRLAYAFWEAELPPAALASAPELHMLCSERRLSPSRLSADGRSIVTLLQAQGCFLPALPHAIPLASVPALMKPIRSAFYAQYYRHRLWDGLAAGPASERALNRWVVHNYHVSRSAGPIAARFARRGARERWRESFRRDALEEYWHCDRFYFVGDGPFGDGAMTAATPLPASTAFEELGLRTAEEDWLGHLLIAWFQESSIMFQAEANQFYDKVERHYGLDSFFGGWRQHMRLDDDHSHAGQLERLFDSDETVTHEQLRRSLRRMQLAHYFLQAALDEIVEDEPGPGPQAPGREACLPLLATLAEASLSALSSARDHVEVMAAGRLHQALDSFASGEGHPLQGHDPWLVAVRNFMVERSTDVARLLGSCRVALEWLARDATLDSTRIGSWLQLSSAMHDPRQPWAAVDAEQLGWLLGRCGTAQLPELAFASPEGGRA